MKRALPLLCALSMLAACGPVPIKQAPPGAVARPTPTPAQSTSPAQRRARPDQPGEYTAGGLYKPGTPDSGPAVPPDVSALPEPVPKDEPRARYGNRSPYTVLGKSYRVMDSARGYKQRGIASWYGKKFHGRATSSLEPYDMYAFSAAHKSLPLPTFARVTNLDNGRSVVVRVNDRGPFHADRLIDLSYAAAIKLGIHIRGTGRVEVQALSDDAAPRRAGHSPAPSSSPRAGERQARVARSADAGAGAASTWIQVASFGDRAPARRLAEQLERAAVEPVAIQRAEIDGGRVYRVRIGPLAGRALAERLLAQVRALGLGQPMLVAE